MFLPSCLVNSLRAVCPLPASRHPEITSKSIPQNLKLTKVYTPKLNSYKLRTIMMKDFCINIMTKVYVLCFLIYIQVVVTFTQSMQVITVQTDNLSGKCSVNSGLLCFTFTELIKCNQQPSNCSLQNLFTSNTITVFNFLPGIHMYSHSESLTINSSALLAINHVTNIAFRAANADTGAIIRCSSDFALIFQNVVNLTISDINIENCGAYLYDPMNYIDQQVAVLIANSENVSILNLKVTNGKQVGLAIVNVANVAMSYLSLINNSINIFILTKDSGGPYYYYNDHLRRFNPRLEIGVYLSHCLLVNGFSNEHLILLQMYFDVVIQFTNTTLINGGLHILIDYPMHSTIKIEQLYAKNTSDDIYIYRYWEIVFDAMDTRPVIKFINSHFSNYKHIIKKGEVRNLRSAEKTMISFSSVNIERCSHPLEWINIKVVLENTKIVNNYGKFQLILQGASFEIGGLFIFQQNDGGIQLIPSKQTAIESTLTIEKRSTIIFKNNVMNNQDIGSILYARNTGIYIYNSTVVFEKNYGIVSGGITLLNSSIFVYGKSEVTFVRNVGSTGGGIAFFQQSKFILLNSVEVQFTENHARKFGGALFVYDNDYIIRTETFQVYYANFLETNNSSLSSLTFSNNTAELSGTALYGGWIDALNFTASIFHNIHNSIKDFSLVSSDAVRICMCINSIPRCEISQVTISTLPGQTYISQLVAVGQSFGTVVSTVHAQLITISAHSDHSSLRVSELAPKEYVQELGTKCTNVSLTVMSLQKMEQLKLTPVNYNTYAIDILKIALNQSMMSDKHYPSTRLLFKELEMTFLLQECPWGFYLDNSLKQCSCAHTLQILGIKCNSEVYKVLRPTPKWIGATYHMHTSGLKKMDFLVHNHCPFDYCKISDIPISLSLETLDDQCALNRSGILCGMCSRNLSQVLGTSQCMKCQKPWIALIVPLIAVAGLLLVAFLIFINLTVSAGTINGLIFYANVVRANNAVFFPPQISNSFLNMFIAWLNLDLGIETCVYDGFDAYAKTWFQFLFPLYIWLLVAFIIIASHYSTIASKLSGNNAVQVLATLFLLSYAKLLRIIITIFASTKLVYPDGYHRHLWLYDGNVDFFKGKHIPLCVAGLVTLVFLSAPYTTILLCVQWLQRYSSIKFFFLVRKLHPLIDAYTGPFKIKHRYWTGFLLLIRIFLFLFFSLNPSDDSTPVNLLVTFVAALTLLMYLSLIKGVYRLHWLNWIENVFLLNLGILAGSVGLYRESTNNTVSKISYVSTGFAFLIFVVIIVYHLFIKLTGYHRVRAFWIGTVKWFNSFKGVNIKEPEISEHNMNHGTVTYSEIRLSQSFIQVD